jgi:hypothetical protein
MIASVRSPLVTRRDPGDYDGYALHADWALLASEASGYHSVLNSKRSSYLVYGFRHHHMMVLIELDHRLSMRRLTNEANMSGGHKDRVLRRGVFKHHELRGHSKDLPSQPNMRPFGPFDYEE